MKCFQLFVVFIAFFIAATDAVAQTEACDALAGTEKEIADSVLSSQYCYDCCDETIATCLEKQPECKLPIRLANYVCRLAGEGKDEETIARALERRALSMMPGKTYEFDKNDNMMLGDEGEVVVVGYICARCPYCSKLIPKLHHELTEGRLTGKVKFYVRLFPIKSHEYGVEANMALAAAAEMGRFWDYALHAFLHFDEFSLDAISKWADSIGLDVDEFNELTGSKDVRMKVVESKKEGLANGVEASPSFFINGRRYVGDVDIDTLIEVVEEEIEATSGE